MRLELSPLAEGDLEEIHDFIARDSIDSAITMIVTIREKCRQLTTHPFMGRARPEYMGHHLRSLSVGQYLIFYRASQTKIEISRIVHGSRDLEALF